MKQDRVLSMLGLARKAGKVVSGEFAVRRAVQSRNAAVVFVAQDAGDSTKKLFHDKCSYYGVPCVVYGTKETLGNAIGAGTRASIAVTDQGFGDQILKMVCVKDKEEL